MGSEPRQHRSATGIPEYLPVKRACLGQGLFSCSQQGFNIAMGSLPGLRRRLGHWLAALDSNAEHWDVPHLIRRDWVARDVWRSPVEEQWCSEQPGGHLLTPRPLFHLLNRLKHHPLSGGVWLLRGECTRVEDPKRTLPLLLQRSFTMVEIAALALPQALGIWREGLVEQFWEQAVAWDLPVELDAGPDGAVSLCLVLAEEGHASLTRCWDVDESVMAAYGMADQQMAVLSSGLERWCLAILARHGPDAAQWPVELRPSETDLGNC